MSDLNELQEKLLEKCVIDLSGEVNGDMANYVRVAVMQLTAKDSPPITIYITSNGGSVGVGLDIYDFIRLYPNRKTGIVAGFARSMGAIILQACDIRKSMRHSEILIHHINRNTVSLDDLYDEKKISTIINDLKKDQERLYEIIGIRSGKDKLIIKNHCEKNISMTSEEALKFGLIDEII